MIASYSCFSGSKSGWCSSCNLDVSRAKYIRPRASRNTRWRTLTTRRSTCSHIAHRATRPGLCLHTRASAKRLIAPQCAHCPSALVTSMAKMLLNSPAAAITVKIVVGM